MSALLNSVSAVSELTVTRTISRIASGGHAYDEAVDGIFSAVLEIPGIWKVDLQTSHKPGTHSTIERSRGDARHNSGSAVAPLYAGLHHWGRLRTHFEMTPALSGSPLRFTRFVAQQIAFLSDRAALLERREVLQRQTEAWTRRLETRKAVARATGLLCDHRGVSSAAALAYVRAFARSHHRDLLAAAQAVVFMECRLQGSTSGPTSGPTQSLRNSSTQSHVAPIQHGKTLIGQSSGSQQSRPTFTAPGGEKRWQQAL